MYQHVNKPSIAIGNWYAQRGKAFLRIVMLREDADKVDHALLEQWQDGELMQYIVTSRLFIREEKLQWHGSGNYFNCRSYDGESTTEYHAFCKAVDTFRHRQTYFVLSAITENGIEYSLYSTRQKAMRALDLKLKYNRDIQEIAENQGIAPLTAKDYLAGKLGYTSKACDIYSIHPQILDQGESLY